MNKTAFSALITGRVQGVGFRWTALERATRLGLHGFVQNTIEGNVEVWAEGDAEKLQIFLEWLNRGPPSARVEDVHVDWVKPVGYGKFRID